MPLLLLLLFTSPFALANKPAPIVFIIQSQPGSFHSQLAEKSQNSILAQWTQHVPSHVMTPPRVILTHTLDQQEGATFGWTIFPLVEVLAAEMVAEETLEWGAVLAENTELDLANLNQAVEKYKFRAKEDSLFLGRSLKDSSSTIVHHFAESGSLAFPDPEAGIFLSRKLVMELHEELQALDSLPVSQKLFPGDFNIDSAYEFARFLYKGGEGVALKNINEICAKKSEKFKCFTSTRQDTACLKSSQTAEMRAVLGRSLLAVKTCSKYHKDRLDVVQKTWGPRVPHIDFVSDQEDSTIPTMVLPYTVNTESGHCNKSLAILEQFLTKQPLERDFLVIVDDDTVLSVARLASLLSCYTAEEGPVLLGQRYGYMAANGKGYNYITGGGGIVMNRAAAKSLAACPCPSEDSPDDMHLGMCARRLGIPVLHSGRMFQARPPDYPKAFLAFRKPVSFHKHWEIDPIKVYKDYFEAADAKLGNALKDEL